MNIMTFFAENLFGLMVFVDQLTRKGIGRIIRKYQRFFGWIVLLVDAINGLVISLVIAICGYPNGIGEKGLHRLWLLVQHQDKRKQLQEDMLKHMQFSAKDNAYLTDRVLVNQKRKQIYGTQFFRGEDGILRPKPIADKDRCNELRRSVGLESLEEYSKRMNKINTVQSHNHFRA